MSIPDKVSAANRINEFLRAVVGQGGLRLKYRITVDPPLPEERDWEHPEILVEFAGPDSSLLLERGAELLRSLELLAFEMLRLPANEHEKICFDCMNHRALRLEELRMSANVAAEHLISSRPCRHANAALYIWPFATILTCAPRVRTRPGGAAWWSIRKTINPQEKSHRARCAEHVQKFLHHLRCSYILNT